MGYAELTFKLWGRALVNGKRPPITRVARTAPPPNNLPRLSPTSSPKRSWQRPRRLGPRGRGSLKHPRLCATLDWFEVKEIDGHLKPGNFRLAGHHQARLPTGALTAALVLIVRSRNAVWAWDGNLPPVSQVSCCELRLAPAPRSLGWAMRSAQGLTVRVLVLLFTCR